MPSLHRAVAPDLTRHRPAPRKLVGGLWGARLPQPSGRLEQDGRITYLADPPLTGKKAVDQDVHGVVERDGLLSFGIFGLLSLSRLLSTTTRRCLRRLDSVDAQRLQSQFGRMDSASGRHGDHHLHRGVRPGGCQRPICRCAWTRNELHLGPGCRRNLVRTRGCDARASRFSQVPRISPRPSLPGLRWDKLKQRLHSWGRER